MDWNGRRTEMDNVDAQGARTKKPGQRLSANPGLGPFKSMPSISVHFVHLSPHKPIPSFSGLLLPVFEKRGNALVR